MATLEEEIRDLKAKIAEYEAKLDAATTLEEKKMYVNLITATRNEITESTKTLNILLRQQSQAQAQGE
jgi:hypothetical protein